MDTDDEKRRRLELLKASMPYLERCSLDLFRVELMVQALDGVDADGAGDVIQRARAELDNEAIVE